MIDAENAVLELVELPDGDIALKRVDSDDSPLIQIHFSNESEQNLRSIKMQVAKAMVEAGMEAFAEIQAEQQEQDEHAATLH